MKVCFYGLSETTEAYFLEAAQECDVDVVDQGADVVIMGGYPDLLSEIPKVAKLCADSTGKCIVVLQILGKDLAGNRLFFKTGHVLNVVPLSCSEGAPQKLLEALKKGSLNEL